nr:YfhO family protein [Facklamia miroungae]
MNLLITFLIANLIAYLMEFIPLGDQSERTMLTIDLGQQYIDFFSLYKRALTEDPRLFLYSFEKGIGGEMIGLWAYYLMSPFNLLLLLFKQENLDLAVSFLTLFKLLAISSSFYYFVEKKYQLNPVVAITFSQAYCFMSYTMAYQLNIMWLDGLFFLPIIALGLDRLIKNNKPLLYIFALTFSMISHYYISYMICLFLIGYCLFVIYEDDRDLSLKQVITKYLSFIKHSFYSTCLAGFLLIPTFMSTLRSKSAQAEGQFNFILDWTSQYSILDLFSKSFIGAFDYGEMASGSANFYVGMAATVLILYYFLSHSIALKEKLISLSLLAFYFASFTFSNLDKLWHLGQFPIWYHSRFSFVVSFFILILAIRAYDKMKLIKLRQILMIILALTGFCFFYYIRTDYSFLTTEKIFYSLVFILLTCLVLYLSRKPHQLLNYVLLILACFELNLNGFLILSENDNYVQPSRFNDYITLLDDIVKPIRPQKNEFYRIYKTFQRTKNESLFANYPSVSHFGSTIEAASTQLYGYLGLPHTSNSINYTSGTLFTDDLFNIRYLVDITSNTNMYTTVDNFPLYREATDFDIRAHEKKDKEKRYVYYENNDLLGLGMEVSSDIKHTKFKKFKPIENQEKLLRLIDFDGNGQPFFKQQPFKDIDYLNLKVTSKGDGDFYTYTKEDLNRNASIALAFETKSDNPYYFTFPNQYSDNKVSLLLNSKTYDFYSPSNSRQVMDAAFGKAGKDHLLRVKLKKDSFKANLIRLYEFDLDRYQKMITKRKNDQFEISSFKENAVEGTIKMQQKEGFMLITLPYDPDWKIKVDDKEIKAQPVLNNTLMAIPLKNGKHAIKMTYFPNSIIYGAFVSLTGALLIILDQKKFRFKIKGFLI